MRLEARKYLYDIQDAAGLAAQFTAGKNFTDYQADPMLRLAVERAFSIIGKHSPSLRTSMPRWRRRSRIVATSLPFAIFWSTHTRALMIVLSGTSWSTNFRF